MFLLFHEAAKPSVNVTDGVAIEPPWNVKPGPRATGDGWAIPVKETEPGPKKKFDAPVLFWPVHCRKVETSVGLVTKPLVTTRC
jgi:hypothetical protein